MKIFNIVLKKELKAMFRNGFSLIISLIVPIIIMPLIITILIKDDQKTDQNINNPKIAIILKDNQKEIPLDPNSNDHKKEFTYIKNEVLKGLEPTFIKPNNLYNQFTNEDINIALYISSNIADSVLSGKSDIKVVYNVSYASGAKYAQHILQILSIYSDSVKNKRIEALGSSLDNVTGINFNIETIQNSTLFDNKSEGLNNLLLISLVPVLIIGLLSAGSGASTSEMFSLEKERNTLESLLSTSADRKSILWAKLTVSFLFSIFNVLVEFLSIMLAYVINLSYFKDSKIYFAPQTIVLISFTVFSLSVFVSMLNSFIYVFAKNNKSAGSYSTMLVLLPIIISYFVMTLSPQSVEMWHIFIPFVGSVFSLKMAIIGAVNYIWMAISIIINLTLTSILLYFTIRRYNSEKLLINGN